MMNLSDKEWGYFTLRLTLGVNMFMHGLPRIVGGLGNFVEKMAPEFENGLIPFSLAKITLYAIPIVELILGAMMLIGFQYRLALIIGAFLVTMLTFGSAANQNWGAVGTQLIYAIAFSLLLFGRQDYNRLALDKK